MDLPVTVRQVNVANQARQYGDIRDARFGQVKMRDVRVGAHCGVANFVDKACELVHILEQCFRKGL